MAGSVFFIIKFGTNPLPSGVSNSSARDQVVFLNLLVWVACIVEVVFSVMMAVAFSILNSIYKNSCILSSRPKVINDGEKYSKNKNNELEESNDMGLSSEVDILSIHKSSPVYGVVSEGYSIVSVNDIAVSSEQDIDGALNKGKNYIEVRSPSGKLSRLALKTNMDSLLVNVE